MVRRVMQLMLVAVTISLLAACHPSTGHSTLQFTPRATGLPATGVTMTVMPLPDYLGVVVPRAGESYTTAEYEGLAPSLGWNATVPGICFSIAPHRFIEPGDFSTAEERSLAGSDGQ
jgi:hypothetical protein